MSEENKLLKYILQTVIESIATNASLKDSPLRTIGKILETHADDIEEFLKHKAQELKNYAGSSEIGATPGVVSPEDDGLPDDERDFVERARRELEAVEDQKGYMSGLLTIIDIHFPKKQITLEGLLERYKGGSIPAHEIEQVIQQSKE